MTYNDASWNTGLAELGYGDGDEATTVSYGPNSGSKYITTYFRKSFTVSNPQQFSSLGINLVRDDGAVVYINGVEVFRSNMPGGNIGYQTVASGTIAWPAEDDVHTASASPAMLVSGTNVIAVEIHQESGSSSDISFNLELTGSTAPVVAAHVRGPYLQSATTSGITVRWRTDVATDSRVNFGITSGNLNLSATNYAFSTEHEVQITGLTPNTIYYYDIGTNNTVLYTSPNLFFHTNPVIGSREPFRFWAIGDAGEGNTDQRDVRDAFIQYNGNSPHADGWLMLGDNAYDGGFDSEYQVGVFSNMYEPILENTTLWPAPGNHDYNNHIPFSPAYYDIFNLPVAGQSGGLASGTEKYYSYDYGNAHFISLDSYDESRSSTAAMATWLQADLAATTQEWIIAYWHHPPYTKGTHDSDNPLLYDFEMVDMRQNILPILENAGVDLVLCGHSHVYERSFLLDGHYGNSGSFSSATHALDAGSGSYITTCPYQKHTLTGSAHKGTVYAVLGCSAKTGSPQSGWPHPAMHTSTNNDKGSLVLDFEANRLDAEFVTSTGTVYDRFTIIKNAGKNEQIQVCPGDTVALLPSWPGQHGWFPGNSTADSLVISPYVNTVYFVSDSLSCLNDTFQVSILPSPPCSLTTGIAAKQTARFSMQVQPSVAASGDMLQLMMQFDENNEFNFRVTDMRGSLCMSWKKNMHAGNQLELFSSAGLSPGVYLVEATSGSHRSVCKVIIY